MRFGLTHWITALTAAVALHAGVALVLLWPHADPGAEAPGLGGIEIALGPAGGAPGGIESAASEQTEQPETAMVIPLETTPVDPARNVPEPIIDAVPEPAPEQEETQSTAEPVADAAAAPEDSVAIAAAPAPRLKPPTQSVAAAASTVGTDGRAGAAEGDAGSTPSDDQTAGGLAGARADYATVLLAWLEQYKEYPRRAQARRQEGVVRLFIAVGRDGTVLEARIERSAGHPLLDQAALDMLKRAAPLPPPPDTIPGDRIEIIVPVHFFLKT